MAAAPVPEVTATAKKILRILMPCARAPFYLTRINESLGLPSSPPCTMPIDTSARRQSATRRSAVTHLTMSINRGRRSAGTDERDIDASPAALEGLIHA